jgi:cytochrome b involved in lipid metabolism
VPHVRPISQLRVLIEEGHIAGEGTSAAAVNAAHGSIMVREPRRRNTLMGSTYTWGEVRQHTSPGDLWLVIDKKVYDVSRWMDEHPGGPEVMLQEAGKDATNAFAEIGHSLYAEGLLKDYYIGDLAGS